ncbi:hypothetical protein EON65_51600 [archaeon]|nr:MAG: hypothetical protein EON65_51600 [archaeon]
MIRRCFSEKSGIHASIRRLSSGGKVYVRGSGLYGALGLGDALTDETIFTPLGFLNNINNVKHVSAGWGHSAAVTTQGEVYVWGKCFDFSSLLRLNRISAMSNSFARIVARSSNSMLFGGGEHGYFPVPTRLPLDDVQTVQCSAGLTVMLTKQGEVYVMGSNQWNQCGKPIDKQIHVYEPSLVPGIPLCKKVEAGLQHVVALGRDGSCYAWGKSNKGQLGSQNISVY